jgi:hypothetical protein
MTLDNIHIDHINPISQFYLDNANEFFDWNHYSNIHPLLSETNLQKARTSSTLISVFDYDTGWTLTNYSQAWLLMHGVLPILTNDHNI